MKKENNSIIANFEKAYVKNNYAKELHALSTFIAFSVLKKLRNVTGNTNINLRKLSSDIMNANTQTDKINYLLEIGGKYEHNKNGDIVFKVLNADALSQAEKLLNNNFGNGFDLVQTASLAILENIKKAEKYIKIKGNFLTMDFELLKPRKTVIINDNTPELIPYTTNILKLAFVAVRREIMNNSSFSSASQKFVYLDTEITDNDGNIYPIYERLPLYSNLSGERVDFNGKITAIVASEFDIKTAKDIISKLNLTEKQFDILQLRLRGYGYKAIATHLHVTENAVYNQLKYIRLKAKKIGFTPVEK